MGLFSRFKKEKPSVDWNDAYPAVPKFYETPDGTPFGAVALTEGIATILPKAPQNKYSVDGQPVSDWKMVLVSTTRDDVLGECDYFTALRQLQPYILDSNAASVLIRGLSLKELEALLLSSEH